MQGKMKKIAVAGVIGAALIPCLIIVLVVSALSSMFNSLIEDEDDKNPVDVVDICVNHEEMSEPYLGDDDFDWMIECRDDIFAMRNCGKFSSSNISAATNNENAQRIADLLSADGFTQEQIAGALGNLQRESGFDPSVVNSVGASGIAQWMGGRLTALQNYASGKNKSWDDLETQVEFLISELRDSGSWTMRYDIFWDNTSSAAEKAGAFCLGFERPFTLTELNSSYTAQQEYAKRQSAATQFMTAMSGRNAGSGEENEEGSSTAPKSEITEEMTSAVLLAYQGFISGDHERYVDESDPDWSAYVDCFTGEDFTAEDYDITADQTFDNLKNAGFRELNDDDLDTVQFVAEMIHGRLVRTGVAGNISDLENYSEGQVIPVASQEAKDLWNKIIAASGNGANFVMYRYNVNEAWAGQCTDFSHWCFYETYGVDWSGGGNGVDCVANICSTFTKDGQRTPDGYYFIQSDTPESGAVFSAGFNEGGAGHTGFVTKVEGGSFWTSEGNFGTRDDTGMPTPGGFRLNVKWSMSQAQSFTKWIDNSGGAHLATGVTYAVPRK